MGRNLLDVALTLSATICVPVGMDESKTPMQTAHEDSPWSMSMLISTSLKHILSQQH